MGMVWLNRVDEKYKYYSNHPAELSAPKLKSRCPLTKLSSQRETHITPVIKDNTAYTSLPPIKPFTKTKPNLPILFHTRPFTPRRSKPFMLMLRTQPALFRTKLLHLLPLLALRLPLLDPQLLQVHIRTIEDGAGLACMWPLLRPERRQLCGLGLLGRSVVLRCDVAEESGLSDAGLLEVGVDFAADFVACIYRRVSPVSLK
jgi:hypothetical protein